MDTITFLRQFRLFDYAVFDFIVSFLGMYLLSPLLSKGFRKIRIEIPKINWVFLTLPIGIISHLLTGAMTPMTIDFLNLNGDYTVKAIILISLILGLRNIKINKNTDKKSK